jgi:opacity protein-like surface antigen
MENKYRNIFLGVVMVFVSLVSGAAQFAELGIGGGATTYWGDLNGPVAQRNLVTNSGYAFQVSYRKMYLNRYGLRMSLASGKMKGDDANSNLSWQQLRNLKFSSTIVDLSVMGEWYAFGYNPEEGNTRFCPFFTAGLSAFRFDPKTVYQGQEVRLQPLGTEGQGIPGFKRRYSLTNVGLPIGGGAKIILTENINISAEVIMRWTATDYIDDVSTTYVTYEDLLAGNGTLAANLGNRMNEYLGQDAPVILETGATRGGAKVNDYYFMSVVSINVLLDPKAMRIGKKYKVTCPKF